MLKVEGYETCHVRFPVPRSKFSLSEDAADFQVRGAGSATSVEGRPFQINFSDPTGFLKPVGSWGSFLKKRIKEKIRVRRITQSLWQQCGEDGSKD